MTKHAKNANKKGAVAKTNKEAPLAIKTKGEKAEETTENSEAENAKELKRDCFLNKTSLSKICSQINAYI